MTLRVDLLAICLFFGALLWLIWRRDRRRARAVRGAYFEDCRHLLEDEHIHRQGFGFPVLEGRYRGHRVRLEPVVDHMAVRKLPSLWILVSVFGDPPVPGAVDFLVRPQNTEFYSPSARLPVSLPIPADWPRHALLRTDIEEGAPPLELLAPHMHLFADERMKELLLTPRGVRLVYQASQGERAYYMVLRQPEFGPARLPAELARWLLDEAVAILDSAARHRGGGPAGRREAQLT
jgi:hypothetical protein